MSTAIPPPLFLALLLLSVPPVMLKIPGHESNLSPGKIDPSAVNRGVNR